LRQFERPLVVTLDLYDAAGCFNFVICVRLRY
jgi:hypothetical protein